MCSNVTVSLPAIMFINLDDFVSDVTKNLTSSEQLACAKIFASFGIISLLSIDISLVERAS